MLESGLPEASVSAGSQNLGLLVNSPLSYLCANPLFAASSRNNAAPSELGAALCRGEASA
jgi:hypothetical protein